MVDYSLFDLGPDKGTERELHQYSRCPHLKKSCKINKIQSHAQELADVLQPKCRTCVRDGLGSLLEPQQVWMCMACGHIFCGRYENGHAKRHFEKHSSDCLMIDLNTRAIWCYLCDDTIEWSSDRNELIHHAQQVVEKYMRKAPTPVEYVPAQKKFAIKYQVLTPGLNNLGNTCYFNSVMQVLAAIEPLHEVISPSPFYGDPGLKVKSTSALTLAFSKFLREMYSNDKDRTSIRPANLFGEIHRRVPKFSRGQQQDAQELLHYLLECLRDDESNDRPDTLKRTRSRRRTLVENEQFEPNQRGKSDEWQPRNYIDSIFTGRLASIIVCDACKSLSVTHDQYEELSLPLNQSLDLEPKRSRLKVVMNGFGRKRSRESASVPRYGHHARRNETSAGHFTDPNLERDDLVEEQTNVSGSRAIALSEVVSEEEADGWTQTTREAPGTSALSIAEAKKRLEHLSIGLSLSNTNQHDVTVRAGQISSVKFHQLIPDPSRERIEYIDRLLRDIYIDQSCSTIEGSLREFTSVEVLEGENAFACEECAKYVRHLHPKINPDKPARVFSESPAEPVFGAELPADFFSAKAGAPATGLHNQSDLPIVPSYIHTGQAEIGGDLETVSHIEGSECNKPMRKYVMRKAYKRFLIADPLPPVLILHLKRFQQVAKSLRSSLRKVDDLIRINNVLDLSPFLLREIGKAESAKYHVVHIGTINSGHYVAYFLTHKVKLKAELQDCEAGSKERYWVFASDSTTRPATWEEVQRAHAYMIVYEKVSEDE